VFRIKKIIIFKRTAKVDLFKLISNVKSIYFSVIQSLFRFLGKKEGHLYPFSSEYSENIY
jgi:hypothetical protein